jgi:DNA end-binding protein Ku
MWTGAISFGLVNVPVKLYSAVSSKSVRFHQLHSEDGGRVKQKRVCSLDGEEVPFDEIVKGYEIGPESYVVITPDELESLDPKATRTIDIEDFVDLDDIDPIYFDHAYYLAPGTGAAKSYKLLHEAMRKSGKAGVARVVMRQKQYLCALRPTENGMIAMSTMNYGDEVVSPDAIEELDSLADAEATDREVKMAEQLIESLTSDWDPSKYSDTYRERVLELIEKKAAGEEIAVQPTEEPVAVPDLMAALEASLAAVRGEDGADANPKKKPAAKRSSSSSNGASANGKAKAKAKAKPSTAKGSTAKGKTAAKKPAPRSRAKSKS